MSEREVQLSKGLECDRARAHSASPGVKADEARGGRGGCTCRLRPCIPPEELVFYAEGSREPWQDCEQGRAVSRSVLSKRFYES